MAEMSLQAIFEAITPESIKDIPVVSTFMKCFIKCVEKNSRVAKNITNLFEIDESEDDSEMLNNAKRTLKKGLYLTYIYTLWNCINEILYDKDIAYNIKKNGYNSLLTNDAYNLINTEFVYTSKQYSQYKGTKNALYYMYHFAVYLETGEIQGYDAIDNYNDLEINEKSPFVIEYEGSLGKKFFKQFVVPMAHPIGWIDNYTCVITEVLHDYFGVIIESSANHIYIYNSDENKYVFFIGSDATVDDIYEYLVSNVINPDTGKLYTQEEAESVCTIYQNKELQSWSSFTDSLGNIIKVFVFTDDTVLYCDVSNSNCFLVTYEDFLENDLTDPIETFEGYVLYSNTFDNWKIIYTAEIKRFIKTLPVTRIRDSDHQVGDSEYMQDDMTMCFKVVGDEFIWLPGIDESRTVVENYEDQLDELAKFKIELNISTKYEGTMVVHDNGRIWDDNQSIYAGDTTLEYSSYSIRSNLCTFEFQTNIGETPYLKVNNIGKFNSNIKLTSVTPASDNTITFKGTRANDNNSKLYYQIETSTGEYLESYTTNQQFTQVIDLSNYIGSDNWYKITIYRLNSLKHPIDQTIYESNIIGSECEFISISYPVYDQTPTWDYNLTEIDSYEEMIGFDSDSEITHVKIGELRDGSFAPADAWLPDFISDDGEIQWDLTSGYWQSGNVLEGSDYNNCYWWSEGYEEEETFIYAGFVHCWIDTSDFIIVSSTRYVQEDFEINTTSSGYYLVIPYEDDAENGNVYFFTTDGRYLYTSEDWMPDEKRNYYVYVTVVNGSIDVMYFRFTFSGTGNELFTQAMLDSIINHITPDDGYTYYEINMGGLVVGSAVNHDYTITINYIQDDILEGD